MVERLLNLREVHGSIPRISSYIFPPTNKFLSKEKLRPFSPFANESAVCLILNGSNKQTIFQEKASNRPLNQFYFIMKL